MKDKNVYYVYTYTDPRNNEVFYVGKGSGRRCFAHLREVFNDKKPVKRSKTWSKFNRIKSILNDGYFPIIEKIKKDLFEYEALKLENETILKYKFVEDGGTLLNQVMENKVSQDLSKSVSESLKEYFRNNEHQNKGKTWSDKTRQNMSNARKRFFESGGKVWNKNKKMSEDFCKINSEGQKRRFQTQRQHNALYWVTPEGIFDSKKSAAEATGLTEGQIKTRCQRYTHVIPTHNKIKIEISEKYGPDKIGLTWNEIGYTTQLKL